MNAVIVFIFYIFAFLSVYVQVFFLVTFLQKRKHIIYHPDDLKLQEYPTVTVAIPCYNEEATVERTVASLQALDYPKDKLSIYIIDDGSTDNTWSMLQQWKDTPGITLLQKENGGKHTALNLALEYSTSEFFGCLDADSFVHPQALKRIMRTFEEDPTSMAVAPSIIVYQPKTIIQKAQKIDYDMAVYTKKMFGFLGGIHVTPGPFSIFRKKVFADLGPYRKAHNTEDQEIALRMQENGYKIEQCADAYIYTMSPNSAIKLYRQRKRWIYGFIRNLIDYRRLLFREKYGTVALFTLPSGMISIFGVIFLFIMLAYNVIKFVYMKILQIQAVGLSGSAHFHFDWFFINTRAAFFLMITMYLFIIFSTIIGRKLALEKRSFSFTVFYFIIIYSAIAPLWMFKAIYNAIFGKESSWTKERIPTRVSTQL